jgi:hypothetical protein
MFRIRPTRERRATLRQLDIQVNRVQFRKFPVRVLMQSVTADMVAERPWLEALQSADPHSLVPPRVIPVRGVRPTAARLEEILACPDRVDFAAAIPKALRDLHDANFQGSYLANPLVNEKSHNAAVRDHFRDISPPSPMKFLQINAVTVAGLGPRTPISLELLIYTDRPVCEPIRHIWGTAADAFSRDNDKLRGCVLPISEASARLLCILYACSRPGEKTPFAIGQCQQFEESARHLSVDFSRYDPSVSILENLDMQDHMPNIRAELDVRLVDLPDPKRTARLLALDGHYPTPLLSISEIWVGLPASDPG